jgi:hypothetical protein
MTIRDVNMNLLDMLEDVCTEADRIPNKNIDLENKLKQCFDYILEIRKLEMTRLPPRGLFNL